MLTGVAGAGKTTLLEPLVAAFSNSDLNCSSQAASITSRNTT